MTDLPAHLQDERFEITHGDLDALATDLTQLRALKDRLAIGAISQPESLLRETVKYHQPAAPALTEEDARLLTLDRDIQAYHDLKSQRSAQHGAAMAVESFAVSVQSHDATAVADRAPSPNETRLLALGAKLEALYLREIGALATDLIHAPEPARFDRVDHGPSIATTLADHLPEEQARLAALDLTLGQQVREGEGIAASTLGQATSAAEPQPGHGLPENARSGSGRTDPARGR